VTRDDSDNPSQFTNTPRERERERVVEMEEGVGAIFLDSNSETVGLGGTTHSSPLSILSLRVF